jgi:glycosyltransferase involved in cell wall biosynthesis
MKILLVSDTHLKRELGASKVVIELAEELEALGWECHLSSIPELSGGGASADGGSRIEPATALRAHLLAHPGRYDVVDYGHGYLPYPRSEFPARMLLVARSVLLIHHSNTIRIPTYTTLKARAHALIFALRDRAEHRQIVRRADVTLDEADLINVANDDDEKVLVQQGIARDKIVVIPYGLSRQQQDLFHRISPIVPAQPTVAFVGTFDGRKGATDLPKIVRRIVEHSPSVRFRLLGTYKNERDVLARFPSDLRGRIQVVPGYPPGGLPDLLSSCSVGIFPSYLESFGFGVLEMLAAGLPVIAYDAPGPPMMLPAKYLVPRGDTRGLSDKVIHLLANEPELAAARAWAQERSRAFLWRDIAARTSEIYTERWKRLQVAATV